MTHTFIYLLAMLNIEESMTNETTTLSMWHDYSANGGRADFEVFYAHTRANQRLLVKVAKGKMSLDNYRYFV